MTRKDYVAIAAAFRAVRPFGQSIDSPERIQFDRACNAVAEHMAQDNPAFDRARFLKACGVQS